MLCQREKLALTMELEAITASRNGMVGKTAALEAALEASKASYDDLARRANEDRQDLIHKHAEVC